MQGIEGRTLTQAREAAGLTKVAVARQAGIRRERLTIWESRADVPVEKANLIFAAIRDLADSREAA